ncbi:MAG: 3-phosphoshikimate 1-carboxyvinyltransferase [Candidatus Xenobia bacterium]
MRIRLTRAERGLQGEMSVPPDKSISHRSLIVGALSNGTTQIQNFLQSKDCRSTMKCLQALGVEIEESNGDVRVLGQGLEGLSEASDVLDAGNSGTTIRLLTGLLCGRPFFSCFTGDASLRGRPMGRVIDPLRKMGAQLSGRGGGKYAPLAINGGSLTAIEYAMPVASAQVKSALLLAGLQATGTTRLREPALSRDHTERMLRERGVQVGSEDGWITLQGGQALKAVDVRVPGDPSSAAFLGAAALLVMGSRISLPRVLVNPTRTGFFEILKRMGAFIEEEKRGEECGEPVADLVFRTSILSGVEVGADEVPSAIDELPLLAVLATQANGTTRVTGAEELRVKESDRIAGIVGELRMLGADITELPDGYVVNGPTPLRGTTVQTYGDHRLAMGLGVAALIAEGTTTVDGAECVDISFPGFWQHLNSVQ